MSLINIFRRNPLKKEKEPTAREKTEAESFKQILKYGKDIGGMYKDVSARLDAIFKEKRKIEEMCKEAIIKQRKIKFKNLGIWNNNWNTLFLREYNNCKKSPLGICVTILEYGSNNPAKDDLQYCFYCNKEYE